MSSKSKIAMLLKGFLFIRNWRIESLQNFNQGFAKLKHVLWVSLSHSIRAFQKMFVEKLRSFEETFAARTPKAFKSLSNFTLI